MSWFADAVGGLFSTDGFVPRRVCGLWPEWLVWEHVAGNALVWIAYLAMSVMIWRLGVRRLESSPFRNVILSFSLFIGLCGLGHFLDMLAFFHPVYRLSGHVLITTGLVSLWTTWFLQRAWPALMVMRSPAELERVIVERTADLTRALNDLSRTEADRSYLATIVESSEDAILAKDFDGIITSWNAGAENIFGYTAAEAVGQPITILIAPERHHEELVILERLRRGEKVDHFESVRLTKDGRVIDVSLSISPIKDQSGRLVGISKIARDITESRRAAELIRANEDRQRRALSAARLAHWEWDFRSDRITYQDSLSLLHGRAADEPFATFAECLGVVHPDDIETVRLAVERSMTPGVPFEVEYRIVWPDATIHWLAGQGSTFFGADGSPLRMVGVNLDITARKEAEAQLLLLNESLERRVQERTAELGQMARLIDQAHDAILVRSREGRITSWNQGAKRVYGWTSEEALGNCSHVFLRTQFPIPLSEIVAELDKAGSWEGEFVHTRKDGEQIVVASRWVVDHDKEVSEGGAILEINSDITERRTSEAALRRSEAALNESQRLAGVGSWEWEIANDVVTWSDELYRIAGRDPSRPPPRYSEQEPLFAPESLVLHDSMLAKILETGEPYEIELEMIGEDGVHRWIIGRGEAIRDPGGRIVMLRGTAQDITERREQREELRRAHDQAVTATRAKGDFLANMSHEIRTPMNGVIGMTELLLDTQLNDIQRDYAQTIRSSGDALLTVLNDILDFSKIEAGKLTIEAADFDLRTLMEEVVDLLAPRAQQKGLELHCQIAREVPDRVVGDPIRIRQILTNLAGNAVKFTDRGGEVVMEAHLLDQLDQQEDRSMLRILVRDTGIGIPEDRHADIFESFTQVDNGRSRSYGGTGLGLAICRNLVGLMGGRIGLESCPGKGSTFWFDLSLGHGQGQPDMPVPRLGGLPVLVIDDQETNRVILRETLLSWDCRPELVGSGVEALSILLSRKEDESFGIILIDQVMPGMDGEQTARVIKAIPRYADVPLVLISSHHSPGDKVDSGLWAARLTKPVRRSQLYNILCRSISSPDSFRRHPPAADQEEVKLPSALRILLAEDNEFNRKVVIGMAERLGCVVESVGNGRDAIEAIERGRPDVVLMDVQMPEMDGFDATAAIRKAESSRHLPIIALTAHAMQGDRERCLAVGMDDYLSKPIKLGPLREALLTWGFGGDRAAPGVGYRNETVFRSFSVEILGESSGKNPTMTRELLGLMLRDVPLRLGRLESAVAARDGRQVSWEAHWLKGTFLTVGADALSAACQELKTLGERGDFTAIEAVHRPIQNQWDRLKTEVTCYLETLGASCSESMK